MSDELKPCPCGAAISLVEPFRITSGQYVLQCDLPVCGWMVNQSTPERAIAAWNRRSPTGGQEAEEDDSLPRCLSLVSWFIVRQALLLNDCNEPIKVGDWVAECSHLIGFAKRTMADDHSIGQVMRIDSPNSMMLKCIDGREQHWENAMFRRLPQPVHNFLKESGK